MPKDYAENGMERLRRALRGSQPLVSPEERYFQNMSPVDQLKFERQLANKRVYSPQEAEQNITNTLVDMAYSTPYLANAMSIRDAYEAKERARNAEPGSRERQQAEAESAASALSAFLPFGIGKPAAGSASRFGVFAGPTAKTADRETITKAGSMANADEALRMERAKQMGYADQPFYRGEASGNVPNQYDTAFFSRDPQYAQGFAEKGGQDAAREFRLNLTNTFSDGGALTAGKYGRLVEAAMKSDPALAKELAESIAPGKGVEWLVGFSKANPDFVVVEPGAAAFVRQAIETNSSDPVGLFRSAGFDAIDSGRDVRKLTGEGIRLKDARFDPSKASSHDIMAGIAGASLLPAYLLSTSRQDQSAY